MSIKIGNNNKIKNSNIIDNSNSSVKGKDIPKESFVSRHPLITTLILGVISSLIGSIIMMFRYWDRIETFIQNLF